jgi:beta-lactam-binding protein with PASTA domain
VVVTVPINVFPVGTVFMQYPQPGTPLTKGLPIVCLVAAPAPVSAPATPTAGAAPTTAPAVPGAPITPGTSPTSPFPPTP